MQTSAEIVRAEMLRVPELLAETEGKTSPLAWKIADTPELELPERYWQELNQLEMRN